jgi:phosphate/sulfate permease
MESNKYKEAATRAGVAAIATVFACVALHCISLPVGSIVLLVGGAVAVGAAPRDTLPWKTVTPSKRIFARAVAIAIVAAAVTNLPHFI